MSPTVKYVRPSVTTLEADEVVELLGPAQANASGQGGGPAADLSSLGDGRGSGGRFGR